MANAIDLKGRNAVVTGGAQGIGRAVVERFIQSGAKVAIWDFDIARAEKTAKENGEKVPAEKEAVEKAIASLREVTGGEDLAAIKSRTEELSAAAMKMGEALYKQQAAQPQPDAAGAAPGAEPPKSDGKTVDAEFEDVPDDKKKKSV